MTILGIETSCDETAVALIETRPHNSDSIKAVKDVRVLGSLIHSQAELHSPYGGVFPTLAKREHGKNLVPLLGRLFAECLELKSDISVTEEGNLKILPDAEFNEALAPFENELKTQNPDLWDSFAKNDFLRRVPKIDAIAVTEGPGLEPTLWVGINFARVLSTLWKIPIIPVNHMEGHIVGSLLPAEIIEGTWQKLEPLPLPSLALLISGGHTELVLVKNITDYKIIGETKDDAVGEAFDKVARLLGLPYPGGARLAQLAENAREEDIKPSIKLPRPMISSGDLHFSFSGLKTAVLYTLRNALKKNDGNLDNSISENFKKEVALEFENAVVETLNTKLKQAIEETGAASVILGGGVSANGFLRRVLTETATSYGIPLLFPSLHVSGDNALMIALAGALNPKIKTPHSSGVLRLDSTKNN